MFFKKKKKDITLDTAIKFMKEQKNINLDNIEKFKELGFNPKDLEEWDTIYDYTIDKLKSIKNDR